MCWSKLFRARHLQTYTSRSMPQNLNQSGPHEMSKSFRIRLVLCTVLTLACAPGISARLVQPSHVAHLAPHLLTHAAIAHYCTALSICVIMTNKLSIHVHTWQENASIHMSPFIYMFLYMYEWCMYVCPDRQRGRHIQPHTCVDSYIHICDKHIEPMNLHFNLHKHMHIHRNTHARPESSMHTPHELLYIIYAAYNQLNGDTFREYSIC